MYSRLQGLAADVDGDLRAKRSAEDLEKMSRVLDMDSQEHAAFQNRKSLAVADGSLAVVDGQWLYNVLGEHVSVFNRQSVGVKYVATQVLAKLVLR